MYTITFDLNGGTLLNGDLVQIVKQGEAATEPETGRSGYTFAGWDKAFDNITEDMTVTAIWIAIPVPEYTVTFDLNGGVLVSGDLMQQVKQGEAAVAPEIERDGYIFIGWDKVFDNVIGRMKITATWTAISDYTPVALAPGYGTGYVWVVYTDTGASGVVYDMDAWNAVGGFGSSDYTALAIAPGYGNGYVWVVYDISGASDVVYDLDAWNTLGGFGSSDYKVVALAPGYGNGCVWVVYDVSGASDVVYDKQAWLDLGGFNFND